ncbi:MAG: hypothetical protein C0601_06470 [Candidatus Muiribacterium halophilum]|uniref:Uncharacterized protein n=1 Tax=Muiribacterium halophilum TaxID=2053465 RepID=A0A2N5ZG93_MUIH1|nr:MAG: hypothetical protein C0601_06470 [Candidatus Muirbacterium halophilum]
MRRFSIFFIFLIIIMSFNSYSIGFNKSLDMAQMTGKDILVFFYRPSDLIWQGFSTNFFNSANLDRLTKEYVLVFLNYDKYINLVYHYSINDPNVLLIIDSKANEIDRIKIDHVPSDQNSFIKAIKDLRESSENLYQLKRKERRYPDNYYYKYRLSQKYLERNKLKKSELMLIDTINLFPTYKKAYISLASLYRMTGNFNEALSILNVAQKLDYENNIVHIEKAKTYFESGDMTKAIKELESIVRPDRETLFEKDLLKVYIYSVLGNRGQAEKALDDVEDFAKISIYTKYAREFFEERFD